MRGGGAVAKRVPSLKGSPLPSSYEVLGLWKFNANDVRAFCFLERKQNSFVIIHEEYPDFYML